MLVSLKKSADAVNRGEGHIATGSKPADELTIVHGHAAKRRLGNPPCFQEGFDFDQKLRLRVVHGGKLIMGCVPKRQAKKMGYIPTVGEAYSVGWALMALSPKLSPDANYLAREIHRQMVEKGIGQKALAKMAGLNETYVRDILRGKSKNPKTEQLQKLADALGGDILDLTGVDIDPRLRKFVNSSDLFPLRPAEVAMVRLWRTLKPDERHQIIDQATAFAEKTAFRR